MHTWTLLLIDYFSLTLITTLFGNKNYTNENDRLYMKLGFYIYIIFSLFIIKHLFKKKFGQTNWMNDAISLGQTLKLNINNYLGLNVFRKCILNTIWPLRFVLCSWMCHLTNIIGDIFKCRIIQVFIIACMTADPTSWQAISIWRKIWSNINCMNTCVWLVDYVMCNSYRRN